MEIQNQSAVLRKEIQTALRHAVMYGLGGIVVKALGFFMMPFYTHYLNAADYGLLEILDLSMSLFGMVLHMGIAPALLRAYASSASADEKKRVVSTAFVFVTVTGALTCALGLSLVKPVSVLLLGPGVSPFYLMLSFIAFILSYLGTMPRAYLRALEKSASFSAVETGGIFAMLALNVYFIAFRNMGAIAILWSSVIVNGVQAVLFSVWLFRKVGIAFDREKMQQMARFGLPLIFSNLSLFILNFSDRFFLQHFQSLDVVGLYAVGYKLAFMLNFLLVQPFLTMWQARMYNIYAKPEHPRIFRLIFILYSLLLTFAALGLALFGPEIVHVMAGERFRGAEAVVPLVALAYVFYGIGHYVQTGLYLTNQTKVVGAVSAVAGALNLGLNYVLVGNFGMLGAAWATLGGFVAIAAGSYWFAQRAMPLDLGVERVAALMTLAGTIFWAASKTTGSLTLGGSLAVKAAMLLAFPVLVWILRILPSGEMFTLGIAGDKTAAVISRRFGWVLGR